MVVYREEGSQKEEDLYDIITVQLTKKSGKGLGLSIVGRKNGPGVFISDVVSSNIMYSITFYQYTLWVLKVFLE